MIRVLIVLVLAGALSMAGLSRSGEAGEVESFVRSRLLIGSVQFAPGAVRLDSVERKKLDSIARRLNRAEMKEKLVRIEGFSSPDGASDQANISLAMQRAQAVDEYLRNNHRLGIDSFLVGFVDRTANGLTHEQKCRVEVAVYDNLLKIDAAPIDKTILRW